MNLKISLLRGAILLICLLNFSPVFSGTNSDKNKEYPASLYEEWRISPHPSNDKEVAVNPPALLWASDKYWHNKDVLYRVYLSNDPEFPENKTKVSKIQKYCFFNPHKKLEPGKWYWKYDIIDDEKVTTKGIYSFVVGVDAMDYEMPEFDEFLKQVPKAHPRVMNQGRDIDEIRRKAPEHFLYNEIVADGKKALEAEIYRGPVGDKNPAKGRALSRLASKDVKKYHSLLKAYVLSGDKKMLNMLLERTKVLLTWPTDDLLGSQVLGALSQGYDILYDVLEEDVKKAMLDVIAKQLNHGLEKWPGKVEARQVENHFWQMEVAGNFIAALATVHDLEESKEMLEYMYELFIARFPNLSTKDDGGWAEGMGYFEVNKSCIVDMALLLKKVGGVDVFKMNWYKNLPDYYNYFAPVDGQVAGFGDSHDRKKNANMGYQVMMVLGHENKEEKALYRLAQLLNAEKAGQDIDEWSKRKLGEIEPWYQIVNNIHFDADKIEAPKNLKSARLFESVGQAAFHTDVLNSRNDLAVYFRSSPFGAKGHMHANQNCFNIARKGERIFYSSGYYTTFADPHSLTSYRHTRAHNTILVNGLGQAFGHEGYGRIKRFINGDNISYVCGDASMAYRPMVDQQFLDLNAENGIKQNREFSFGDAKLRKFERHLIFIQPGFVVIYDVLEAEEASDWSFLLHSMKQPELHSNGILYLNTGKTVAEAFVIGSCDVKSSLTDKFFSPQIDIKKKYGPIPNHFHATYSTMEKTEKMRFLSVLQFGDAENELLEVEQKGNNSFVIGDVSINVELDVNKPGSLTVTTEKGTFFMNSIPEKFIREGLSKASLLVENKNGENVIYYSAGVGLRF